MSDSVRTYLASDTKSAQSRPSGILQIAGCVFGENGLDNILDSASERPADRAEIGEGQSLSQTARALRSPDPRSRA
jgi:hypothetical protein